MAEVIRKINGVEICTEDFGDPTMPAVLLMMGATASMMWWDDRFCTALADQGRYVIRYDNRDTGQSTCYEPGRPPYNVIDLADDAVSLLDSFGLKDAHLVGMSLGGMIAQIVAIRNPDRVRTVTAISSSVWDDRPELMQMDEQVLAHHATASSVDWSDRRSVVDFMVEGCRILNGSAHVFNENAARKLAERDMDRARSLLSMFNHAQLTGGEDLYGRSVEIRCPFLIIHGTEDPILPFAHARALHADVAGSTLLALEGVGHELHEADWPVIIDAIIAHTSK